MDTLFLGLRELEETAEKIREIELNMSRKMFKLESKMNGKEKGGFYNDISQERKPLRGVKRKNFKGINTMIEINYMDGEKEFYRWYGDSEKDEIERTEAYNKFFWKNEKTIFLEFINEDGESELTQINRETIKRMNIKFEYEVKEKKELKTKI